MKPALLLSLSFGILSLSLGAFGQPPAPKTDPGAAQTTGQPPAASPDTPPGTQPVPGMQPPDPANPPVVAVDIEPDYVLGETDTIVVNVWKEASLTGGLTVRPDGRISLPLIGDLPAAGLTPMALASEIADHLKKFINDPTVTVTVTASNSRHITFSGEVNHQGAMPLARDMTMLQAIASAGGLSPYANKKKIYILRDEKSKEQQRIDCEKAMAQKKPCEQPKQQKIFFDYNKALKKGDMQGVTLKSGDTVVVP
jgi:polysaccharide export outer membrane protein